MRNSENKINQESNSTESMCHRIGISGNCGLSCEVFLDGKCQEWDEMIIDYLASDASQEDKESLAMSYGVITP